MTFPYHSFSYVAISAGSLSNLVLEGGKYGCATNTITNVTVDNSTKDNDVSDELAAISLFKQQVFAYLNLELNGTEQVIIDGTMSLLPVTSNWYSLPEINSDTVITLTFTSTTKDDIFVIYNSDVSIVLTDNIKFRLSGPAPVNNIYFISNYDVLFSSFMLLNGNFIANGFASYYGATIHGTMSALATTDSTSSGYLVEGGDNVGVNYAVPTLELTYRMRQLNRSAVQTETSALRKAYHARADLRNSEGTIVGYIETFNRVAIRNGLNTFNTDTSISLYDTDTPSTIAVKFSYISATSTLTSTIKSVASAYSGKYSAPPLITITPVGNKRVVTITDAANVR